MWAIEWHFMMVVYVLRSARQCGLHTGGLRIRISLAPGLCVLAAGKPDPMVVTGSNERLVGCSVPDPWSSYWITAAGLLDKKSLVYGRNAAKGSRQTGCAPSEDAVAPEARSRGPVESFVVAG